MPLSDIPIRSDDIFAQHKTTERFVYAAIQAHHPHAPDVILWNEDGLLTETTIGNLVLSIGGELLTPALAAGLLPGTMRQSLLDEGTITEKRLAVADLERADGVWMINSVRGWTPLTVSSCRHASGVIRSSAPSRRPEGR